MNSRIGFLGAHGVDASACCALLGQEMLEICLEVNFPDGVCRLAQVVRPDLDI